jgi:DNA replication protein DnaC
MPTGDRTNPAGDDQPLKDPKTGMLGDPNCEICGGIGYIRLDLPVGHPDFGKVQICPCRNNQVTQQIRQRLFALSQLDELKDLTFENFNSRGRMGLWPKEIESLEQAYNLSRIFAQQLKGWLLLQGNYGCGKTHLAAAIANFAVSMGVPTLFITVPDLLDSLRYAYQDPTATFEERFERVRNAALLVLDDFGTQNATGWAQEKLFQIINFRYINQMPTVITTNLNVNEIEGRIRSRLEDPELVSAIHIKAPDYRDPAGDPGHHKLSSLGLMHQKTFASFDLRQSEDLDPNDAKSIERAFNAARTYADNPTGWLVLTGPYGCGKTHLAAAIANYRAEVAYPPLFIVVPDLLDHLRATFSPNSSVSLDHVFEEVRTTPFLILDDLGTQSTTPWVREKLYQLFNHRYNAELPTVITTAKFKEEMDERLRSRMEDTRICSIYAITAPAYRGYQANPKSRSRSKRAK